MEKKYIRETNIPSVAEIFALACEKGNQDGFDKNNPTHKLAKLALIVDEVAEEIHNVSKGNDDCSELVDVIIRIYSYIGSLNITTIEFESMIREKHEKNKNRPTRHGKIAN